jgi:RNA polymerase sigma factor (sigma-70 family)
MANTAEHNPQAAGRVGAQPPVSGIGAEKLSLEQVVSDHLDEITRLTYRLLGWQSDVEDVVQDVFLSAAQKLNKLRNAASIRAWLFQITINKCRTYRYRQKFHLRFLAGYRRGRDIEIVDSHHEPDNADKYAEVRRAVKTLPAKYREAVVLKYLEQLSHPQIAGILGVKESTLNVRLLRARTMLREKLKMLESEK